MNRPGANVDPVEHAAGMVRAVARWRMGERLTANQAEALLQTWDAGSISAADLSRGIGITTASMSRLLAVLEVDGWVVRAPDPRDARRAFVQPSKQLALAVERLRRELEQAQQLPLTRPGEAEQSSPHL